MRALLAFLCSAFLFFHLYTRHAVGMSYFGLHEKELQESVYSLLGTLDHNELPGSAENPDDDLLLSMGSGFWVKSGDRLMGLSAAHVIMSAVLENGELWAIDSQIAFSTFSKNEEYILDFLQQNSRRIPLTSLELDPEGPHGDFVKFEPEGREKLPPNGLSIRNLLDHPLLSGEELRVVGRQSNKLRIVECQYLGLNGIYDNGGLEALLRCGSDHITDSGEVDLGGVSGGPIIDSDNLVVGIFTGAVKFSENPKAEYFLRGSLVFFDDTQGPRLYPEIVGEIAQMVTTCVMPLGALGLEPESEDDPSWIHFPCEFLRFENQIILNQLR